jgi:hypothetical protein
LHLCVCFLCGTYCSLESFAATSLDCSRSLDVSAGPVGLSTPTLDLGHFVGWAIALAGWDLHHVAIVSDSLHRCCSRVFSVASSCCCLVTAESSIHS